MVLCPNPNQYSPIWEKWESQYWESPSQMPHRLDSEKTTRSHQGATKDIRKVYEPNLWKKWRETVEE